MKSETDIFIEYWEELSSEFYPYLVRKTNKNDAEDIFQDIAQLAYRKFAIFRGKEYIDFKRWIYGVASKKIMKWRSKQYLLSYFNMGQFNNVNDMGALVDELINTERKELLKSLMGNLSPFDKRLILLRNFKELSYEEIAKQTGKSKSALMTRHTRILKRLYRLMKYYEDYD